MASSFHHRLRQKHLGLHLQLQSVLLVGHIQQCVQLLVRLVDVSGFEAGIDNLVFETNTQVLAFVAVFFHEYHGLFDILFVVLHEVFESEFPSEVEYEYYFFFIIVVVGDADTLVIFTDLMQQV